MAWQKYKSFENDDDAAVLVKLLEEHRVKFKLEKLTKNELNDEVRLPITINVNQHQVRKVDKLLLAEDERQSAFETIENFDNIEQARDLLDLLEKNGIPYTTGETGSAIDTTHTNSPTLTKTYVMVQIKHFEKVNTLQAAIAKDLIQDLGTDYHLYQFKNQELLDILEHQDEWHINDVLMAQRILAERGMHYSQKDIELMKQRRWIDLRQTKPVDTLRLAIAYILAFLGGFVGLFMGWHYAYDQGYDPDGRTFYTFDTPTREHGIRILKLSVLALIVWVIGIYMIY